MVYDPTAGFVTGGGWIMSPAAACQHSAVCQGAVGKASFGFVSRYQQGATTPTGNTEFVFEAGQFRFRSTSYQWLVVSGARAQYKGAGTVNGRTGYSFLLTAVDGTVSGGGGTDAFRIKITDDATGAVVYDNKMGADDDSDASTLLDGATGQGSIIIHAK